MDGKSGDESLKIPVYFMGGQYNHLIVRALKELGVESRLVMPSVGLEALRAEGVDGLVMGGGPHSVIEGFERLGRAPEIVEGAEFPVLGICLSHQLIGKMLGGEVVKGRQPEYGRTTIEVVEEDELFQGVPRRFTAWASHNDEVRWKDGACFRVLAESDLCRVEALRSTARKVYGVQFHIEVSQTEHGKRIMENFRTICKR